MSHDDKQSLADNQKLDHVLQKKQAEENRVIKLLLLGTLPRHAPTHPRLYRRVTVRSQHMMCAFSPCHCVLIAAGA
jgi:hypothetical protein